MEGRPERLRILFSGSVVSNGGDRAIVESQISLLSEAVPDAEFVLADNRPEVARRLMPSSEVVAPLADVAGGPRFGRRLRRAERTLRRWRLLAAARAQRTWLAPIGRCLLTRDERDAFEVLADLDAAVYCGGTSLVESYWLEPKFLELQVLHALRIPITLMTQSLGPFAQRRNRRFMVRLSRHAALILLRDDVSRTHLIQIGADVDRAQVLPDVVFSLADPRSADRLRSARLPGRGARIAISVRTLANYKHLSADDRPAKTTAALREFVTWLVEAHDAEITFVSTCQGVPEYWTDDSEVASDLVGGLPRSVRDRVTVDHEFRTTDGLLRRLAEFDLVVATRLHTAILALAAGTPVLPIAYEFKTHTVFAGLGVSAWVQDVATLDTDSLRQAYENVLSEWHSRSAAFATAVEGMGEAARQAGPLTVAALRSSESAPYPDRAGDHAANS